MGLSLQKKSSDVDKGGGGHSHEGGGHGHDHGSNSAHQDHLHVNTEGGAGSGTKVDHTTGEEVDTYLSAHPFLSAYVAEKFDAEGNGANGKVNILDAGAFKDAWVAYATVRTNPDTGSTFTEAEALAWEPTVNAYQGDGQIYIHEERGEAGTAIHESVHLFAHSTWVPAVGFNANEGTTEYFTRMVCDEQGITRGAFYTDQRSSVEVLAGEVGDAPLASAFFQGDIDGLESEVNGSNVDDNVRAGAMWGGLIGGLIGAGVGAGIGYLTSEEESPDRWTQWLAFMKAGQYSDADALF